MNTSLILVGPLYTDIVAGGLQQFPKPGGYVYGNSLRFCAGGKACNIAQMAARLLPPDIVAMVSRTVHDQHGLWELPIKALREAGVNIDAVVIDKASAKLPGMTLITVDNQGNNQVVVLPGVSDDFSKADINVAASLFSEAAKNNGLVGLTLETSLDVAEHATHIAKSQGLRIVVDPGGMQEGDKLGQLLNSVFLVKPNEHEAKMLTNVTIDSLESAQKAATILMDMGAMNVLITAGATGAYLITKDIQKHIPAPDVTATETKDETGCGDQVMATICAYLQQGRTLEEASQAAIVAGTLQFHKQGIQPISKDELEGMIRT